MSFVLQLFIYFDKNKQKEDELLDKYNEEEKRVQYYSSGQFSDKGTFNAGLSGTGSINMPKQKKKKPGWLKALLIIACLILGLILLGAGCDSIFSSASPNEVVTGFGHDYIGTLYVEDTIDEYGSGLYNHQYLLNAIDAMIEDDENKGMILYVNTPGGSVYASDELYLKIKEYQEKTKRPVYSSMQSQATSGGYYISASADKIIANRNCWTGSIGVTMGTFIDVSELLSNLGVKTTTVTAGNNKAMGSNTEPMTDEQKAIFQSLVDESYEQFVGIIAEGRKMTIASVKALADGRIYTAKQALGNGLIDEIGTYEDAIADMKKTYNLKDVEVEDFRSEASTNLYSLLGLLSEEKETITDAEAIEKLLELNGTFRLSYISNVTK